MAEAPGKETKGDQQPEATPRGASSWVTATVVSLAALVVIGAAAANSLPSFDHFSLPGFSLPSLNHFSLPSFDRFALPNFDRFAAPPPQQPLHTRRLQPRYPVTALPRYSEASIQFVKDIQLSQQQNAAVLVSLTQSSANQQADLKRISRQLNSLAVQTEALQSAVTPLTTGSIPHSNARARILRTSRRTTPPTSTAQTGRPRSGRRRPAQSCAGSALGRIASGSAASNPSIDEHWSRSARSARSMAGCRSRAWRRCRAVSCRTTFDPRQ